MYTQTMIIKRPGSPGLEFAGSPSRTRTYNLVVNSHPLCRLSYRGMLKLNLLKIPKVSSVYYFKVSDCIALDTSGFSLVVNPAAGRDYCRLSYRGMLKLNLLKIPKVSSVYYFKVSDCIALDTSGFSLVVNPAAGRDYCRLSYRGMLKLNLLKIPKVSSVYYLKVSDC